MFEIYVCSNMLVPHKPFCFFLHLLLYKQKTFPSSWPPYTLSSHHPRRFSYLLAVRLYHHHVPRFFEHLLCSLGRFRVRLGEENPRMKQPRAVLVVAIILPMGDVVRRINI